MLQVIEHGVFVALLAVCAIRSLSTTVRSVPVAIALGALGSCYLAGIVLAKRRAGSVAAMWWFAALSICWLLAALASAENVWLAFPLWLLAGHLLPLPAAVIGSGAILALTIALPIAQGGVWTPAGIVGPVVGSVFAVGISRGQLMVVRQAEQRRCLVRDLVATQREMSQLHDELARVERETGALAERARLAGDIHDTLAQGFSSILLLARAATRDRQHTARLVAEIEQTAATNLAEARRVVHALSPTDFDDASLPGALRRLLGALGTQTGIATSIDLPEKLPVLETATEVALLRAAQSALANVRAHAKASRVAISLMSTDTEIRLDIVDDGKGFDVAGWEHRAGDAEGGYGLRATRNRLVLLGGGLDVESAPGSGTALSAHLPIGPVR